MGQYEDEYYRTSISRRQYRVGIGIVGGLLIVIGFGGAKLYAEPGTDLNWICCALLGCLILWIGCHAAGANSSGPPALVRED